MTKHVAVVLENIPNCSFSGGTITGYAIVQSLIRHGYQVSLLILSTTSFDQNGNVEQQLKHLRAMGVTVHLVPESRPLSPIGPLQRLLHPSLADLAPGALQQPAVYKIISMLKPDGVVAYHWNAVASVYGLRNIPKLAFVGDPMHLPVVFRKQFVIRYGNYSTLVQWRLRLSSVVESIHFRRAMRMLLNDFEYSGVFAAHHANLLKSFGVRHCAYVRTPTPDPFEVGGKSVHSQIRPAIQPYKILHIGHLQGIATLTGIELMTNEILPALERMLPTGSYEVHIVGGHYNTIPQHLQDRLHQFGVKIQGQISPADEEFLTSHVVLVPTPIELGIRVRILTAFSFGRAVVAHRANAKGVPELIHGENCLLGDTGEELALAVARIAQDAALRQHLERNARRAYERHFSLESAGGVIVKMFTALSHPVRSMS